MYDTLIQERRQRLPEDSSRWAPVHRPFRRLPNAEPQTKPSAPVAPVIVAWLLVLSAYGLPFTLLTGDELMVAIILCGLITPALGVAWISQFRPVPVEESGIRSILWSSSGLAILGVATSQVFVAIALVPMYAGFGLLTAVFTTCLLNPRGK